MKGIKRILALTLVVFTLVSLMAACGDATSDTPTATPAGDTETPAPTKEADSGDVPEDSASVTIGYIGDHHATHPASLLSNDFITQGMVYDRLFEVDDNTGEYGSRVLESWDWEDSLTFRVTFKDSIYFSDGKQMTGEDLLYTMKLYIDKPGSDKYSYFKVIDYDNSYVTEDGLTVYVKYFEEYGPAYQTMDCYIMQKDFTEAHDEADTIWFTDPVGSGPYKITNCVMDSSVTFTRRDDYWNSDYSYDAEEITIKFYSDETAMYADYQNGVIDVAYGISSNICEQIEASGSGTVQYISENNVSMLCFNEDNEYLADPVVREAIAHALDMDAISDMAYGKLFKPARSHFGAAFDTYTEHEGYSYDVEYAKQLLADAGYAAGEIVLDYVSVTFAPQPLIAEAVQGYLEVIGITVNVNAYDLSTALSIFVNGETDLSYYQGMGGNPTREPNSQINVVAESATFACMSMTDATLNGLMNTAKTSVDTEAQYAAYREVDDWLYDNFQALPICETLAAYAYNSRIATFNQCAVGKGCLGSLTLS